MAVPLSSALSDPDWLPHTYDYNGGQLTFVNVPRPGGGGRPGGTRARDMGEDKKKTGAGPTFPPDDC